MGKRKTPVQKRWRVDTRNTYLVHARIPKELMEDLRDYVNTQGTTITEVVTDGIAWIVRGDETYVEKRRIEAQERKWLEERKIL